MSDTENSSYTPAEQTNTVPVAEVPATTNETPATEAPASEAA